MSCPSSVALVEAAIPQKCFLRVVLVGFVIEQQGVSLRCARGDPVGKMDPTANATSEDTFERLDGQRLLTKPTALALGTIITPGHLNPRLESMLT